jgi:hypothetical protein
MIEEVALLWRGFKSQITKEGILDEEEFDAVAKEFEGFLKSKPPPVGVWRYTKHLARKSRGI